MLGWGGAHDRRDLHRCSRCCRRYNGKGDGDYNYGRYTNAKLDELTAKVKIDMNAPRAPGRDPRGAARAQRRDQPPPAAPAGDPVGDAQQRHRGAPRRQQRHPVLGDDQVAARPARRRGAALRRAPRGSASRATRRGDRDRDGDRRIDERAGVALRAAPADDVAAPRPWRDTPAPPRRRSAAAHRRPRPARRRRARRRRRRRARRARRRQPTRRR